MVPGFGDTPLSWLPIAKIFMRTKEFRQNEYDELVLLEFSGYIGSLKNRKAIDSISAMINAVTAVLLPLAPHTLIGHSMGGFLSAYFASELGESSPSFLKKLILLCPSGMSLESPEQKAWETMLAGMMEGNITPFIERALGPVPQYFFLSYPYKIILEEFSEFLARKESLSILSSFEQSHEMTGRVSKIRVPTLLIWGKQDPLIPFVLFDYWAKELKAGLGEKFQSNVLENGTHRLHIETPVTIAKAIAAGMSEYE